MNLNNNTNNEFAGAYCMPVRDAMITLFLGGYPPCSLRDIGDVFHSRS